MSDRVSGGPSTKTGESGVDGTHLVKMAIDIGPLIAFFAANFILGNIFVATATFMVGTLAALAISYRWFGRIPPMPLVSGVLVLVFGGLTLWFQKDEFIKIKPTVVYALFAVVLLSGLAFGKYYLRVLMGELFQMTELGWRILTMRWAAFFVVMAALNEIVWRNFSADTWIAFKLMGAIPLTVLFGFAQLALMKRHAIDPGASGKVA